MYKLLPLPYLYQDLEPFLDTHTIGLHYHKHEQNYMNKLNEILRKNNYQYQYTLPQLFNHIHEFPKEDQVDLLYNLGGVLNHDLYFRSMSGKEDRSPKGKLKEQILKQYGSLDILKRQMKERAMALKGSGYTFLVAGKEKILKIVNTKNQDTPISNGELPLLNIDMWEHAYYLNYKNEKEKYLDNFFIIMDFNNASEIYNRF